MYLEKVNRTMPREIFQLGAYNDDTHHSSAESETDSHLRCNNSASQLVFMQMTIKFVNCNECKYNVNSTFIQNRTNLASHFSENTYSMPCSKVFYIIMFCLLTRK